MATAKTLDKSKLRISFNNARLLSVLDNRNLTYEVLTVLTNFYFSEMLDAQYAVAWIDTHADFDRKILDTETQGVFNMEITKQEGYYTYTYSEKDDKCSFDFGFSNPLEYSFSGIGKIRLSADGPQRYTVYTKKGNSISHTTAIGGTNYYRDMKVVLDAYGRITSLSYIVEHIPFFARSKTEYSVTYADNHKIASISTKESSVAPVKNKEQNTWRTVSVKDDNRTKYVNSKDEIAILVYNKSKSNYEKRGTWKKIAYKGLSGMDLFIGTSTANKEWRRRILLYKGIEVVGAGKFDVDYYFPESVEKRRLEKIRQEEERKKAEELERIRKEEQAKEEERKYQAQLEQLEIYMRNRTRTERKVQLERICKTDTLLRKKEAESPYIVEAYRIASQQDLSSVYTYLQNFQPVTDLKSQNPIDTADMGYWKNFSDGQRRMVAFLSDPKLKKERKKLEQVLKKTKTPEEKKKIYIYLTIPRSR